MERQQQERSHGGNPMTMISLRRMLAVLVVLITVPVTHAAGPWVTTKVTQIQVISTSSGDRIYVLFETPLGSECTPASTMYAISPTTAQGKNLYAMALMAKATDASVDAFTNGCDDLNRNILGGIWIH
jgi:hypothetical protein